MVSPVLLEQWYTADFLVRDLGTMSRDIVTLTNPGAVDLLIQGGTVFSFANPAAAVVTAGSTNTGNGVVTGATANPLPTQLGTYAVTFTAATTFGVTAPDGDALSNGTVGVPYADGIGFLVNAGGTAFVAGDHFTVTLADGVPPVVVGTGNTGNGTLTQVEIVQSAQVLLGNYIIDFTAPTTFNVTAPDGRLLRPGTTGQVYEDEITFLITAGSTAYVAGDRITIGFGPGTGLASPYTGAMPAAGIIYNRVYAPAGGTVNATAIMRNAEVNAGNLQFGAGVTAQGAQTAILQLKQLGILAR